MGKLTFMTSITMLLCAYVYAAAADNSYFKTNGDFLDLYCPAPDAGPGIVESLSVCGHRCSGTFGCVGFFYNSATRACNPRVAVPDDSECDTESGSRYFHLIDCGEPPDLSFATLDSGATYLGSVRVYTCDSRYRVKTGGVVTWGTTAAVTCQSNATWGGDYECVLDCDTNKALVTGSGGIADYRMTASSAFNSNHQPYHARLDGPSGWAVDASNLDTDSYIQLDFTTNKIVTAISTQGMLTGISYFEWISSYHVLYSTACVPGSFVTVKDATGSTQTFNGNTDTESHVTNTFARPILARCVRVNARTWNGWISMRVELYGC